MIAVAALIAGCSSKPHRPQAAPATAAITTTLPAPSTTQPDSTDPAVVPILNDLLHQWDRLMTIAFADPAGWVQQHSPEGQHILDTIFTADSPFVADFDNLVGSKAGAGLAVRPSAGHLTQHTHVLSVPSPSLANQLNIGWCSRDDGISFDVVSSTVEDDSVGLAAGTATLVRVDGRWQISDMQQVTVKYLPAGAAQQCPPAYIAP